MSLEKELRETLSASGIQDTDIQKLDQAVSALQNARGPLQGKKPRFVCAGLYNMGKSTLLNALTGSDFDTGDVPTTKGKEEVEFGGAIYIDTPGLNAEEADDQETERTFQTADFILYTKNAEEALTAKETEWLQRMEAVYTAEGFARRLIFVMTHSDQVDEEKRQLVFDKFMSDLESSLGYRPRYAFDVDSITYLDGKEQNDTDLMEDSKIPELIETLKDIVKRAEQIDREAWDAEVAQRKQNMRQIVAQIRGTLAAEQEGIAKESKQKLEEVDQAWSTFESLLKEAEPSASCDSVSADYVELYKRSREFSDVEGSSESSVYSNVKRQIRPYYDKRSSAVREVAERSLRSIRRDYCSTGFSSAYAQACEKAETAIKSGMECLLNAEIHVKAPDAIQLKSLDFELPSNLYNEVYKWLTYLVVKTDGYQELERYANIPNISHTTKTKTGMFGSTRWVDWYECSNWDISRAVDEMQSDINEGLSDNEKYATETLQDCWSDFRKALMSELDKRKAALKQQVEDYKQTLQRSTGSSKSRQMIEAAMRKLAELEKKLVT